MITNRVLVRHWLRKTRVDEDCESLRNGDARYTTQAEDRIVIGVLAALAAAQITAIVWIAWRLM
jgi:hypothetical protein